MKSFTDEQKSSKTVYTNRSESLTTSDFEEYSVSDPFYLSARQLFYPDYAKSNTIFDFFDESLNSRITFQRNSEAWYWNENGLLSSASADEPRFDYDPATLQKRGLLVEESRTNEITSSRNLTAGSWSVTSASVIRDEVGIDGVINTANTVTFEDVSASLRSSVTIPDDSSTHVGYYFLKKTNNSIEYRFNLTLFGGTIVDKSAVINASDGSIISNSFDVFKVEDKGDWWLLWGRITNNGTGNTSLQLRARPSSSTPIPSSFIIDQAQVELNATRPTSPIVTNGSTVRREADDVYISNVDFLNDSEGSFFVSSFYKDRSGYYPIMSLSDNTISNKIESGYSNNDFRITFTEDGNTTIFTSPLENTNEEFKKLAYTYNFRDESVSTNEDVELITSPIQSVSWANIFHIGSNYNGSKKFNGHIQKVVYYDFELSEDQIENIT